MYSAEISHTIMSLSGPNISPKLTVSSTSAARLVGSDGENKIQSKYFCLERTKERIKKILGKVELSVSAYDTAWVAMIPSANSPQYPLFPQCLNWLLENQLFDGSWGSHDRHPLLMKDTISSTLACVLALKQWGISEEQINRGLQFIGSSFASVDDEKQCSPIGFDIIFPSLIERAHRLELKLPLGGRNLDIFTHKRELELKRGWEGNIEGWRAYQAYISEGLGKAQNWKMVMKYQRKNGSLFNSPATTAAAFSHLKNPHCLNYLHSLLDKFGNAVPTVYPFDIYARLHMVDSLEKLGIDCYFREEIRSILDVTYRFWLQGEEDIFLEPATCAMAFRLLRLHGYDVSSAALSQYSEENFSNSLQGYLKDVDSVLELYNASQLIIHSDESVLEELKSWTRHFLKQELSHRAAEQDHCPYKHVHDEVNHDLRFPYDANLDRLLHQRSIELYNVDQKRISKTSYSSLNLGNEEFLKLAMQDFNIIQSMHCEEYKEFNRWVVESRLDKLEFGRQKQVYCYLTAAATLPSPELSDVRVSWAKNTLFIAIIDYLFDVWGSEEEQRNLVQLVEKWNVDISKECCSERVEILFSALQNTICEIAEKAYKLQGRSVMNHLIEIWLDLLQSWLKEAEWSKSKYVPTIDEYMANAWVSAAVGPIVIPVLYLIGPKLSKETVQSAEYNSLFELASIIGRLLNDINSFKREFEQGKLNAVTLQVINGSGSVTEEEIIKEIDDLITKKKRELLRLVLKEKGSIVPRACKDVYWKLVKVVNLFYLKDDGFNSHEMINTLTSLLK